MTRVPVLIAIWYSRVLLVLSCLALLAMALHVTADVIMRAFFNSPIQGTLEIGTHYYMVAVSFLALGWVQIRDGHIAVEFVVHAMRTKPRMVMEFLALLVTFIFSLIYLRMSWVSAMDKTGRGEYVLSQDGILLIWPSRWILVVSVAAFVLVLLVQLVRMGRALGQGQVRKVVELLEEDITPSDRDTAKGDAH